MERIKATFRDRTGLGKTLVITYFLIFLGSLVFNAVIIYLFIVGYFAMWHGILLIISIPILIACYFGFHVVFIKDPTGVFLNCLESIGVLGFGIRFLFDMFWGGYSSIYGYSWKLFFRNSPLIALGLVLFSFPLIWIIAIGKGEFMFIPLGDITKKQRMRNIKVAIIVSIAGVIFGVILIWMEYG